MFVFFVVVVFLLLFFFFLFFFSFFLFVCLLLFFFVVVVVVFLFVFFFCVFLDRDVSFYEESSADFAKCCYSAPLLMGKMPTYMYFKIMTSYIFTVFGLALASGMKEKHSVIS